MVAFSFLAAAVALPLVLASPALQLRQDFPAGCGSTNFPGDFNTASDISLTALNTTLPNSISTGAPLAVALIDIFGAESSYLLATAASAEAGLKFTSNDFALTNGALTPIVANQKSTDSDVVAGSTLEFQSATGGKIATPAQVYCGLANTDAGGGISEPLLSIQGDSSDFSLCQSGDLNVVVFEPTSDNSAYDFDSCYGVDILIFEH